MKQITLILIMLGFFSCNQQADKNRALQNQIDSLKANAYKPGFGEFMSSIQVHHNKLWFAGQNQNWKLADFEVHEIMETIDAIKKYQTERKESKMTGMISAALDSINHAIQQKNTALFKSSYVLLTNKCNSCHQAAKFEFNVVKIPDLPPYSNQDFKTK